MDFAFNLDGNIAPFIRKYQVAASVANPGVFLLTPAANGAGLATSTTTSLANAVGLCLDTVTYVSAQQTDGSSAERVVSVIVNPHAVYKALMSGGASEGTALALQTVTTASATGVAVTTAAEWSSPTFDEGIVWGYDGANGGGQPYNTGPNIMSGWGFGDAMRRKLTSVSSTAGTVTTPFDRATVVGDNFLRAPYYPNQTSTVQLTTNLYQADASIAVGTGGAARVVDLELNTAANNGRTTSMVYFTLDDMIFNVTT